MRRRDRLARLALSILRWVSTVDCDCASYDDGSKCSACRISDAVGAAIRDLDASEKVVGAFQGLFAGLVLDHAKSPWSKSQGVVGWVTRIRGELKEFEEAAASGDRPHTQEELGDLLWTVIACALATEAAGGVTIEGALNDALAKLHRRKPWVFEDGDAPLTPAIENERFMANKQNLEKGRA